MNTLSLSKTLAVIAIAFWFGCTGSSYWGDKDLGGGYYLWKDGKQQSIIYSEDHPYNGTTGFEVIPIQVLRFGFDHNYITVESLNVYSHDTLFWLIDKRKKIDLKSCHDKKCYDSLLKSNVAGPLDSLHFIQEVHARNVNIELK